MNEIDAAAGVERLQRHGYNLGRSFVLELRRVLGRIPAVELVKEAAWPAWVRWHRADPTRGVLGTDTNGVLFVQAWKRGAADAYDRIAREP